MKKYIIMGVLLLSLIALALIVTVGYRFIKSQSIAIAELEDGDCIESGEITNTLSGRSGKVSCDTEGAWKVFATNNQGFPEEGIYPQDVDAEKVILDFCQAQFLVEFDTEYSQSEETIQSLYPSEENWEDGDRTIVCATVIAAGTN